MSSFKVTHISAVDKRAIRYHVMDDTKKTECETPNSK